MTREEKGATTQEGSRGKADGQEKCGKAEAGGCQLCGQANEHMGQELRQFDERLQGMENMLETLISRSQGESRTDRLSPLMHEALNGILTEVGEIKDDTETLKRWMGGLREDVETLQMTVDRQEIRGRGIVQSRKTQVRLNQTEPKGGDGSLEDAWSQREVQRVEDVTNNNAGTNTSGKENGGCSTPISQTLTQDATWTREVDESLTKDPLEGSAWRQGAPGLMVKREWSFEKKERIKRLNNVVIGGLATSRGVEAVDLVALVKDSTGLSIRVLGVIPLLSGELLFKLATHQQKRMLVSSERQAALKQRGVEVRDDLTPRQEEVASHLNALAARARELGRRAPSRRFGLMTADSTGTRQQQNCWLQSSSSRSREVRGRRTTAVMLVIS